MCWFVNGFCYLLFLIFCFIFFKPCIIATCIAGTVNNQIEKVLLKLYILVLEDCKEVANVKNASELDSPRKRK